MISLGFSPCPNDTFIFYALVNKKIDLRGLDFSPVIKDVETLNQLAIKRAVDVTKISCHAFYYLQKDYQFLRSGGAFGRGCGPLLVQKTKDRSQKLEIKKIAIPGELTTAFLLLKLYLSSNSSLITPHSSFAPQKVADFLETLSFIAMPFNKIMDAVKDEKVDAGLIIHESRFTYHEYGLAKIADLGDWWEKETGLPIPLGGIIAKKSLGTTTIKTIESLIRASVEYSMVHKEDTISFIKNYSQELSDDVIFKHISLYVNNYTIDIGSDGEAALNELIKRAKK
ncbi:1,4-dihydroxy-6-naphtoate synthase [Dissulfurispira thermophila]|uniref:1,4-dihydroxy-6-naphtoate synthase n=2 Tax=root TaxID=1 RepID=A0A7G1H472_9BACT|nr:1,4-dihydroxy-6-naphthoate synthase [Dissulfurispira thermophila]BCB96989.1 1,4-dihydroxy-6-naphtoate synthase [Dissulfurispira thermophila]